MISSTRLEGTTHGGTAIPPDHLRRPLPLQHVVSSTQIVKPCTSAPVCVWYVCVCAYKQKRKKNMPCFVVFCRSAEQLFCKASPTFKTPPPVLLEKDAFCVGDCFECKHEKTTTPLERCFPLGIWTVLLLSRKEEKNHTAHRTTILPHRYAWEGFSVWTVNRPRSRYGVARFIGWVVTLRIMHKNWQKKIHASFKVASEQHNRDGYTFLERELKRKHSYRTVEYTLKYLRAPVC